MVARFSVVPSVLEMVGRSTRQCMDVGKHRIYLRENREIESWRKRALQKLPLQNVNLSHASRNDPQPAAAVQLLGANQSKRKNTEGTQG